MVLLYASIFACINCGYDYKEERLSEIVKKCEEYRTMGVYGIMAKHVTVTPEVVVKLGEAPIPVMIRDSLQTVCMVLLYASSFM